MADWEAADVIATADVEAWRDFRKEAKTYIDLSGGQFSNLTLSYFDFSGCDIDDTLFDDCFLEYANFSGCNIRRSRFRKCDLTSAKFVNTSLEDTSFDKCDLFGAEFDGSVGLTTKQLELSFGDERTTLPEDLVPPDGWYTILEDDDYDQSESSNTIKIPEIPERVLAPVETGWLNERLRVIEFDNNSLLGPAAEDSTIRSLKENLENLIETLKPTNFDQRVVGDLSKVAEDFPGNSREFRSQIFSVWYRFRPAFEYTHSTKGNHSDYIEAKVISFELNLRDILASYPEWREYQAASQAIRVSEQFDSQQFISHQREFAASLQKIPEQIDPGVPENLNKVILIQETPYLTGRFKSVLYGAAASIANIISRIISKVTKEIADGSLEGVKEGTKKLVSATIAAGGGSALLWFLTTGIQSFVWLKNAWDFVRKVIGY